MNCCICEEDLNALLEGESVIKLTCGDSAHHECYCAILTPQDVDEDGAISKIECPACSEMTRCNMTVHDAVARELIVQRFPAMAELTRFETPDRDYEPEYNYEFSNPQRTATSSVSSFETASPVTPKSPILEDSLIPKLNFIPSCSKVFVDQPSVVVDCKMTVQGPQYKHTSEPTELPNREEILESFVNDLRFRVLDWMELDIDECGELVTLDRLRVGVDELSYEWLNVYLFSKNILLVRETDPDEPLELVGSLRMDMVSNCFHTQIYELTVHLSSLSLSEVFLLFDNSLTLKKWLRCINCCIRGDPIAEVRTDQLTSNLWDACRLVSDPIAASSNPFLDVDSKVSFILVVDPLLDQSPAIVAEFMAQLSKTDRFGVVFVHRATKTFYGLASRDWEGWADLLGNFKADTRDWNLFANLQKLVVSNFELEDLLNSRHGFRHIVFFTGKPFVQDRDNIAALSQQFNCTFTNCHFRNAEQRSEDMTGLNFVVNRWVDCDIPSFVGGLISDLRKSRISEFKCGIQTGENVRILSVDNEERDDRHLHVHVNNMCDDYKQEFSVKLEVNTDNIDFDKSNTATIELVEYITQWCEEEFDNCMSTTTKVRLKVCKRIKDIVIM